MKFNLLISTFAAAICFASYAFAADAPEVRVIENVVAHGTSVPLYVSNRAPLAPSPFIKLPIGSITPKGWLRQQLQLETDGMTGHLEEISRWCKFDGSAWTSADGLGDNGWEELPYWLKGYGDLGYVLKDEKIIHEARRWIDGMLSSQEPDGYFGPRANVPAVADDIGNARVADCFVVKRRTATGAKVGHRLAPAAQRRPRHDLHGTRHGWID